MASSDGIRNNERAKFERGADNKIRVKTLPIHYPLDIPMGNVVGVSSVNKFGRAISGIQVTATDVWDRADATPTQQIWTAPTTARLHNIASSSASDAAPSGVGARTIRISGLTSWATSEVSEDIILNGAGNVPTVNAYVIIHRMEVLTKGATSSNVGIITATAQTDVTVTAQINVNAGQTQMAIYGVPSNETAYLVSYYASMVDAGANPATANAIDFSLLVNPEPDAELQNFLVKHTQGGSNTSTSKIEHFFNPYFKILGPAIIKLQGIAFTADSDLSGGFDLIRVVN